MPREATTEYYSGQGVIYLAENDATTGAPLGFEDVGNCANLKLSFKNDVIDHKESRSGNRVVDMRLATGKTADATFVLDSFASKNIARAMFGLSNSATAGTAVVENVTAYLGKVVPVAKIKLSNVSVKNSGGTITYELNKNYTINAEAGSIYFMSAAEQTAASPTNSIADAATIKVTYDHAAQVSVDAFATAQKEYTLRFEGLNTAADNAPVVVTIPRFRPDPLKDLSIISDTLQTFEMGGAALMVTSTGKFVTVQKLT